MKPSKTECVWLPKWRRNSKRSHMLPLLIYGGTQKKKKMTWRRNGGKHSYRVWHRQNYVIIGVLNWSSFCTWRSPLGFIQITCQNSSPQIHTRHFTYLLGWIGQLPWQPLHTCLLVQDLPPGQQNTRSYLWSFISHINGMPICFDHISLRNSKCWWQLVVISFVTKSSVHQAFFLRQVYYTCIPTLVSLVLATRAFSTKCSYTQSIADQAKMRFLRHGIHRICCLLNAVFLFFLRNSHNHYAEYSAPFMQ